MRGSFVLLFVTIMTTFWYVPDMQGQESTTNQATLESTIRQHIDTLNKSIEKKNDPMRNKMYFEFRLIEQDHPGIVAPFLIENLKSTQAGVPEYTAFILGWINDNRAIAPLMEMLKQSDSKKIHAARALGFMRANESIDAIIALLKDPSVYVRRDAAYSLGLMGNDQANKSLKEAEQDSDDVVRFFATEALERIENYKKFGW